MRAEYILYGFGALLSVAGVAYLAAEFVQYLSDWGKLGALLLTVGLFSFLGKYFEKSGM